MAEETETPKDEAPVTLEDIEKHLTRMEEKGRWRSELDLLFNTGFVFIGIGIGLILAGLPLAHEKVPYWPAMVCAGAVTVATGVVFSGTAAQIDARQNKTGDSH
jgi:hypothetical protein